MPTRLTIDQTVSAADANRSFSKLLREVQGGRSYVVTSHGRPVARLCPLDGTQDRRAAARTALFERLRTQPALDVGPWTRDELYER